MNEKIKVSEGSPLPLIGAVQDYYWGKTPNSSIISNFEATQGKLDKLAEIWFGTHPKGPANVRTLSGEISLTQYIQQSSNSTASSLPYLLKVLSIAEPLSIQIHPNDAQAQVLHSENSKDYLDPNRKVELAFALGDAKILWGMRPSEEIKGLTPILKVLGIDPNSENLTTLLVNKICAVAPEAYLEINRQIITSQIFQADKERYELLQSMVVKYGDGDLGILWLYLLNLLNLKKGQSIATHSGIIHAYLEGEMVELMTPSDNVIRAGLTKKRCDLINFSKIANSKYVKPEILTATDNEETPTIIQLTDNSARLTYLHAGTTINIKSSSTPMILLCLNGTGVIRSDSDEDVKLLNGGAFIIPEGSYTYLIESIDGDIFLASS